MKPSNHIYLDCWHYVKELLYWLLLIAGIVLSWCCVVKILMCYCCGKSVYCAEFVISIVVLISVVVFLVLWGFFIKELILNEYNNYHEDKIRRNSVQYRKVKKLKKELADLRTKLRRQGIKV